MDRDISFKTATSEFLRDFAAFEGRAVNAVLASLTADAALFEPAQKRLGWHARLTLIKRLAMVRVDSGSLQLLDRVIERSAQLQEKYDELISQECEAARAQDKGTASQLTSKLARQPSHRVWLPTLIEIYDCIQEVANLATMLETFVENYRTGAPAFMSPVSGDNRVHNSGGSPAAF